MLFFVLFLLGNPQEPLAVLQPLIGPTWKATFPGSDMTDTQTFEWVFDRKFVRNIHWVTNAKGEVVYRGEALYAWDPKSEQIVWWYWNATGGYIEGTSKVEGKKIISKGINHAPPGQPPETLSEMVISDGEWQSIQFFKKETGWEQRFSMTFKVAPNTALHKSVE